MSASVSRPVIGGRKILVSRCYTAVASLPQSDCQSDAQRRCCAPTCHLSTLSEVPFHESPLRGRSFWPSSASPAPAWIACSAWPGPLDASRRSREPERHDAPRRTSLSSTAPPCSSATGTRRRLAVEHAAARAATACAHAVAASRSCSPTAARCISITTPSSTSSPTKLVRLSKAASGCHIPGPRAVASPTASTRRRLGRVINQPGEYRVALLQRANGAEIELAVMRGAAELVNDGGRTPLRAGERAFARARRRRRMPTPSTPRPGMRSIAGRRRGATSAWASRRSICPTKCAPMRRPSIDDGSWRDEPSYGHVWYPRVDADWRPYYHGRWASIRAVRLDVGRRATPGAGRRITTAAGDSRRARWFWIPGALGAGVGVVGVCARLRELVPAWLGQPAGFAINVLYGGGRYDPWRAGRSVPRRHFGRGYVHHHVGALRPPRRADARILRRRGSAPASAATRCRAPRRRSASAGVSADAPIRADTSAQPTGSARSDRRARGARPQLGLRLQDAAGRPERHDRAALRESRRRACARRAPPARAARRAGHRAARRGADVGRARRCDGRRHRPRPHRRPARRIDSPRDVPSPSAAPMRSASPLPSAPAGRIASRRRAAPDFGGCRPRAGAAKRRLAHALPRPTRRPDRAARTRARAGAAELPRPRGYESRRAPRRAAPAGSSGRAPRPTAPQADAPPRASARRRRSGVPSRVERRRAAAPAPTFDRPPARGSAGGGAGGRSRGARRRLTLAIGDCRLKINGLANGDFDWDVCRHDARSSDRYESAITNRQSVNRQSVNRQSALASRQLTNG